MILTDTEEYYKKRRMFRNHNIRHGINYWQYQIRDAGYNYRLSDIHCALGISQLKKLDKFIARRREIVDEYNRAFAGMEQIITPTELSFVRSAYHLYVIQLNGVDREKFIESLVGENIGAQIHYIPTHLQPCMKKYGYKAGDFPKAEAYYNRCVSLPIFPAMSDEDVQDVIDAVKRNVKCQK